MTFDRPDIIRPPSEWASYFLPLTKGCSNNTCTFCNYHATGLQIRALEDVKAEIDSLAAYRRKGIYTPGIPRIVYEIGHS